MRNCSLFLLFGLVLLLVVPFTSARLRELSHDDDDFPGAVRAAAAVGVKQEAKLLSTEETQKQKQQLSSASSSNKPALADSLLSLKDTLLNSFGWGKHRQEDSLLQVGDDNSDEGAILSSVNGHGKSTGKSASSSSSASSSASNDAKRSGSGAEDALKTLDFKQYEKNSMLTKKQLKKIRDEAYAAAQQSNGNLAQAVKEAHEAESSVEAMDGHDNIKSAMELIHEQADSEETSVENAIHEARKELGDHAGPIAPGASSEMDPMPGAMFNGFN